MGINRQTRNGCGCSGIKTSFYLRKRLINFECSCHPSSDSLSTIHPLPILPFTYLKMSTTSEAALATLKAVVAEVSQPPYCWDTFGLEGAENNLFYRTEGNKAE